MPFQTHHLSYPDTHSFSQLVYHYLDHAEALKPFYRFQPGNAGVKEAMEQRKFSSENRAALIAELNRHYNNLREVHPAVKKNLELLAKNNCFTVCTAHQPNIFTGHLYFVYKILHAIKLAVELKGKFPDKEFVPVYFMGSEDADLDELGEVHIEGEKRKWQTDQAGAVGRMKVDKTLLAMIEQIAGSIEVHPHGKEVTSLLRRNYVLGVSVEQATFTLVNELFGKYGLIILLPDTAGIKQLFLPVMERELKEQFSAKAVEETLRNYPEPFRLESFGREINLFYLDENGRNRIEKHGDDFWVVNTGKQFRLSEILEDIRLHPERFSPNVILRPVLQEAILPNVAFIGGGGELAYWLRLKNVFEDAGIDFPVLILRNSYLLINKKYGALYHKLGLNIPTLFKEEKLIADDWVKRNADVRLTFEKEKDELFQLYSQLQQQAGLVDVTLAGYGETIKILALKKIASLEKKMLRAEKRKHDAALRQIHTLKTGLFPGGLQERVENIMPWLAVYGFDLLQDIFTAGPSIEPAFTILEEQ